MYKNFAEKVTFIKDIFTSQGCVVPKVQDVIQNHNWIRTHPHSSKHQGLPKTGRLSFLKIRAFSIVSVATGKNRYTAGLSFRAEAWKSAAWLVIPPYWFWESAPTRGQVISLNLVFRNSGSGHPLGRPLLRLRTEVGCWCSHLPWDFEGGKWARWLEDYHPPENERMSRV